MCLYTRNKSFVAENDIICYKVFEMGEDGKLVTPFRRTPMDIGKAYEDKNFLNMEWSERAKLYNIEGGVFHAFRTLQGAVVMMQNLTEDDADYSYVVVECIIPKGSYYYIGKGGQIASRAISLKREVPLAEMEKIVFYSTSIYNGNISCFWKNKAEALKDAKKSARLYNLTISLYKHQFGEKIFLEEIMA